MLNCSQMSQQEAKTAQNMSQQQAEMLQNIINKNDTTALEKLLEDKAFNINGTGLRYGIRYNYKKYGRNRIGDWKEEFRSFLSTQLTPLEFATSYAKPEIVRMLLQSGANPNQGIAIEDLEPKAEGNIYYPLTIGYSSNFSGYEEEALIAITEEFLKTNISRDHFNQALNFVDTVIDAYSPPFASKLRKLFQNYKIKTKQIEGPAAPGGPKIMIEE